MSSAHSANAITLVMIRAPTRPALSGVEGVLTMRPEGYIDYLLALLTGVLLACSFPAFGHPAAAWIALVPLLLALTGWPALSVVEGRGGAVRLRGQPPFDFAQDKPLRAFLLGLAAGIVYFAGTIYWTGTVVQTFGGLAAPVALLAMVLLAAYLALFPALTALITSRLIAHMGLRGLWLAPAAWVATEFFRGYLFGGFPWVPLGNSQVTVLPIVQIASLLGVYGVSALVAFVNAAIAYALVTTGRTRLTAIAAAVVVLATVGVWGAWRIADGSLTREGTPIKVGLAQGNIEQSEKWRPESARRIFTTYISLTREMVGRGAEYVIWPESSTPFTFESDPVGEMAMRDLAREVRVPILFGSDQEVVAGGVPAHYNAAFQLLPDGTTGAVYRKIHLLP